MRSKNSETPSQRFPRNAVVLFFSSAPYCIILSLLVRASLSVGSPRVLYSTCVEGVRMLLSTTQSGEIIGPP